MDSMAAEPLHAEEKGDGGLKLCSQEQHLEVEEGLLVHREVGLACRRGHEPTQREAATVSDPGDLPALLGGKKSPT